MLSHRPSTRFLALAALVAGAAVPLAGCNTGRTDNPGFGATQTVTVTKQVGAPPVISATPEGSAAVAAPAPVSAEDSVALDKAVKKAHKVTRALHHERKHAAHAQKAAKHREHKLRRQLESERRKNAHAKHRASRPVHRQSSAPIRGSDVSKPVKADGDMMAARSQVVTFHKLLDQHDPAACDLLTQQLLLAYYGPDPATAPDRCRATVQGLTGHVTGKIQSVTTADGVIRVRVLSQMGESAFHNVLVMQLVDGQWLIGAVQQDQA